MTNEPYNTTEVHFTDLSTFNTCERQYSWKNVERIKRKPKPSEVDTDDSELLDDGKSLGTYGHKLLEESTYFSNAELFDLPDGPKKQIACMVREHDYFQRKVMSQYITVMHEEEFLLKWEDWEFRIRIDKGLIHIPTNNFCILDYKFYKSAPKYDNSFFQDYQVRGYLWAMMKLYETKHHTFPPHKFLLSLLVKRNIKNPYVNQNGLPSLANTKLVSTSFPLLEEWQLRNGGLGELEYTQAMNYLKGTDISQRYRIIPFGLTTRQTRFFEDELRCILQRIDQAKVSNFFMRQPAYHCGFCDYFSMCEDLIEHGALNTRATYFEKKQEHER